MPKHKERMLPYGRQDIDQDDARAVLDVLMSDYLTQGPQVPEFETRVKEYVGANHAVATCNATSALHLACRALDLGPGDVLWTSPVSFVASANCARYCGAEVDFVDIDPSTYNFSVDAFGEKLALAATLNRLPKIVVPVHLGGQSCDMLRIRNLAKKYGVKVIEDASHAVGASYKGQKVGSCAYSDITIFSFHPVKIITTGEGGMAITNNKALADKMRLLCSHGIIRNAEQMDVEPHGPWYYQQIDLGYNYRMTDLQAALGRSQMNRLDDFVASRRALAQRYFQLLKGFPVQCPNPDTLEHSSFHLFVIRLGSEFQGNHHRRVFEFLRNNEIGVNLHYIPIHIQPYYRNLGFKPDDFMVSMEYYESAITLPLFPGLTYPEQDKVVEALSGALSLCALP